MMSRLQNERLQKRWRNIPLQRVDHLCETMLPHLTLFTPFMLAKLINKSYFLTLVTKANFKVTPDLFRYKSHFLGIS